MNQEEFIKFILSIGFKHHYNDIYSYKSYRIDLDYECYDFYNGSEWDRNIYLNDLTPLKKIIRSYKLKNILE